MSVKNVLNKLKPIFISFRMKRPLSSYNALFYHVSIFLRRFARYINWILNSRKFAKQIESSALEYRVYKHQSVLIRKLGGTDLIFQQNKVDNLIIAIKKLNGIIIRPCETFSFCFLVGQPTKRKGYKEGILLCNGEAKPGIGGGLCQISNLIHWLCLHSPLTVTERHHHSFDPFPDEGRVVPFGSGASIFYNYMDYQLRNDTEHTFQLLFWLDKKCINGDLRVDSNLPHKYHIYEKNHKFIKDGDYIYRRNELWRDKYNKIGSGEIIESELLQKNNALVKYTPDEVF